MPVDLSTIALAGVRAARNEMCRAAGLLHDAIRIAAGQGVSDEKLARAAGTSIDRIQRIATELDDPAGRNAGTRSDQGGRGDTS